MCSTHYAQWRRRGQPEDVLSALTEPQRHAGPPLRERTCSLDFCDEPGWCRGLCRYHYGQWKERGHDVALLTPRGLKPEKPKCKIAWCERFSRRNGYCDMHERYVRTHGCEPDEFVRCVDCGAVIGRGTGTHRLLKYCDACRGKRRRGAVRSHRSNVGKNYAYEAHLIRTFGIDLGDWQRLFDDQGGVCAICGTSTPGRGHWHTDHCHSTGKVRGILCGNCNRGIGCFHDDPERLLAAVGYLAVPA
jgi:hypothetical protein